MLDNSILEAKVIELRRAISTDTLSKKDIGFATSLCDQFFNKGWLSEKQQYWVQELLKRAGTMPSPAGSPEHNKDIEEIFDGTKIRDLLHKASATLKFPKLRYQTDGRSKIVFGFVVDTESKWAGCTFIDNGARAENKKRYGFIGSNGQGTIRRESPPEIKTLIREVAKDPVATAKLQGQKYTYCCFCGLELVNKSSVHHGYGPICASKYGLPWGDTGDIADEEAAAEQELKHIQLHDLE